MAARARVVQLRASVRAAPRRRRRSRRRTARRPGRSGPAGRRTGPRPRPRRAPPRRRRPGSVSDARQHTLGLRGRQERPRAVGGAHDQALALHHLGGELPGRVAQVEALHLHAPALAAQQGVLPAEGLGQLHGLLGGGGGIDGAGAVGQRLHHGGRGAHDVDDDHRRLRDADAAARPRRPSKQTSDLHSASSAPPPYSGPRTRCPRRPGTKRSSRPPFAAGTGSWCGTPSMMN